MSVHKVLQIAVYMPAVLTLKTGINVCAWIPMKETGSLALQVSYQELVNTSYRCYSEGI